MWTKSLKRSRGNISIAVISDTWLAWPLLCQHVSFLFPLLVDIIIAPCRSAVSLLTDRYDVQRAGRLLFKHSLSLARPHEPRLSAGWQKTFVRIIRMTFICHSPGKVRHWKIIRVSAWQPAEDLWMLQELEKIAWIKKTHANKIWTCSRYGKRYFLVLHLKNFSQYRFYGK